ncbi:MAG: ParA family protein [Legionellaceae bacterium]|nr:ParA family protein [Legionellaceae bacterium]
MGGKVNVTTMQKGGVGKTTVTFNIGKGLTQRGYRVLLIDGDPQGDLTQACIGDQNVPAQSNTARLYERETCSPIPLENNLNLIGTDIELSLAQDKSFEVIFDFADSVRAFTEEYDFILIDSLPSFGIMHTAALLSADTLLIPTKAAPFSLKALKMLYSTIERVKRPRMNPAVEVLGILINHEEGAKTSLGTEVERLLREHYKDQVFENKISRTVKLEESPAFQESIMDYDPNSKAAKQYEAVVDEFISRYQRLMG